MAAQLGAPGPMLEAIMRARPGEKVTMRIADGEPFDDVPRCLFTAAHDGRLKLAVNGGAQIEVDTLTLIEIAPPGNVEILFVGHAGPDDARARLAGFVRGGLDT